MESRVVWNNEHTAELGIFSHNGKEFSAGGSYVSDSYIIGYCHYPSMTLTSWDGKETIGTIRIVSTWRTPSSYVSSYLSQIEATINGKVYTGRSGGDGMVWKGKPKKSA
jgi:hypothetical protein